MKVVTAPPGFAIKADYFSHALQSAARAVPGVKWSPERRQWEGREDAIRLTLAKLTHLTIDTRALPKEGVPPAAPLCIPIADSKLRDYQKTAVNFLLAKGKSGALLADDMGLGKAMANTAPVLTPSGWRAIGALRKGDFVIGSNGQATKVLGVYPQGKREIFEVIFSDGARTTCCNEHLWAVHTPNDRVRGGALRVKQLADIRDEGVIDAAGNKKWFTPVMAAAQFAETTCPTSISPYSLGALLANGHFGKYIGLCASNEQLRLTGLPAKGTEYSYRLPAPFLHVIRGLGLAGLRSWNKHIPQCYLWARSVNDRFALLSGLLDNDGTISKDGMTIEYNTVSKQLAADVIFLVRSLGGIALTSTRIPHFTYKGQRKAGRRDYRIRISLPPELGNPFRVTHKASRFVPRTKYKPARAIAKIRKAGKAECVCIKVDAADSLYVTSDFVVTHNTCSALTAARALDSRTLIVCPSYVRGVWFNETSGGEFRKWWPAQIGSTFLPSGTKPESLEGWGSVVIHYDILHAWLEVLLAWAPHILIFDECHALMSENSRRSKAARAIAAHTPYRWGLSGTPLTNRPRDLWNVADTLCPGVFGNFFSYAMRYCDAKKEAVTPTKTVWKFDGKSNLPELNTRLKSFMLRRVKADVALELPPKTRQSVFVDVPQKAQSFPGEMNAKAMRGALDKAADAKLEDAARLVISHLEAGHKVVCFTYRQSVAEGLADAAREAGYETGVVHGGIAPLRRGKAIQSAKDSPGAFLLSATIDSSGTGIDLSFADVCVFAELSYEPHKLLQAEARLHRFGQANPVLIQYVIARGTTDELVANVVIGKLDSFELAVGTTGENLQSALAEKTEDIFEDFYKAMAKLAPEKIKGGKKRVASK